MIWVATEDKFGGEDCEIFAKLLYVTKVLSDTRNVVPMNETMAKRNRDESCGPSHINSMRWDRAHQ